MTILEQAPTTEHLDIAVRNHLEVAVMKFLGVTEQNIAEWLKVNNDRMSDIIDSDQTIIELAKTDINQAAKAVAQKLIEKYGRQIDYRQTR